MAYLVLARKYRPQTFDAMSGQAHVVRTLSNALEKGQVAHAFLFTGPRGVGKTTTARLVAKALNCERGPTAAPCGACTPCVEIAEGRAVDVVEIDAASNNGVDNVRDIVEAVKYRPARDRFKIFVVDEVHMLSTGAFNALLKTLEEPPAHVKFVLATTDVHKVPETIVSRCQRFDFKRLTLPQIADQLGKVAQAEGMTLSPAALALVARQAEGGMRDALSLLDQVRAACGEAPSDGAVAEALGAVDAAAISRLAGGLVARDGAAVLAEVQALHARGLEIRRIGEELVRHLRNVVVARLVPAAPLDLPDAELAEVRAQAGTADPAQLTRLFDLAQRALEKVKEAEEPRYALEVALLEGVFLAPGADIAALLARAEQLAGGALPPPGASGAGGAGRAPPRPAAARGPGPTPTATSTATATSGGVRFGTPGCASGGEPAGAWRPLPADAVAAGHPSPLPLPAERGEGVAGQSLPEREGVAGQSLPEREGVAGGAPATAVPGASAAETWRAAVEQIEAAVPLAASALKQAAILHLGEGEVALQFPTATFSAMAERKRAEIEAAFARFFGRPTRLAVSVGAPPAAAAGSAAAPAAPAGPSIAQAEAMERHAREKAVRDAARAHPNIREAARLLEGGIEKIEEL
jgi:DNA polymerase-3 subunit gamma/tau